MRLGAYRTLRHLRARTAITAAARTFPAAHFAQWSSDTPVPFTVEPDGRVWGHAAGTDCHRGMPGQCLLYTADVDPDMGDFHTGDLITLDNGDTIRVGPLRFAGLHADTPEAIRALNEDPRTTVALVRAWDDNKGRLSIAGTLVEGVDQTTRDQLAAASISYERIQRPGGMTLLGLKVVNVPGHPVAASMEPGVYTLRDGVVVGLDCTCDDGLCAAHAKVAG